MIEIGGKKDPVHLILTPEIQEALDLLVKCRELVGIHPENIYLFPRTNGEDHIDGCTSLNDAVKSVEGLQFPERICSTTLRKYIATVVQVMDLNDIELEWLTNHLGHSIRIHKDFYRNQTPSIELGRIAKMLLAVDKGICLKKDEEAFFDVCETDDEDTIAEEGINANIEKEIDTNTEEDIHAYTDEQSTDVVAFETDLRTDGEESSSEDEENTTRAFSGMENRSKRRRVSTKSIPWTEEENRAIVRQLGEWIYTIKQAPKKEACERAQQNESVLQNRSWYKIKWKVYNLIQADKRKAMP